MGNTLYGAVSGYSCYELLKSLQNPEIKLQKIVSIEERCTNLESLFNFKAGKHSYLVLTTDSGAKIRVDYYTGRLKPDVTFYYVELYNSECFRYSKVNQPITLTEALKKIKHHCMKERYNPMTHNCQHVSRDSFNEITHTNTNLLRNDYLEWYQKSLVKEVRDHSGINSNLTKLAKKEADNNMKYHTAPIKVLLDFKEISSGKAINDRSVKLLRNFDFTKYLRSMGKDEDEIESFNELWREHIPTEKDVAAMRNFFNSMNNNIND